MRLFAPSVRQCRGCTPPTKAFDCDARGNVDESLRDARRPVDPLARTGLAFPVLQLGIGTIGRSAKARARVQKRLQLRLASAANSQIPG